MADDKLPKTWAGFCAKKAITKKEAYIKTDGSISAVPTNCSRSWNNKNILPSKKAAEAHLALMQLHQLRDCYRQGWRPDMTKNERVYCILPDRRNNTFRVDSYYTYYRFLTFQTKELAEEFLKNFSYLIMKAIDILI